MPFVGINIGESVGITGVNRFADVKIIQTLLNTIPADRGGPNIPLAVDGKCGPKTCAAIYRFQGWNVLVCDGRVDPGKRTFNKLLVSGQPVNPVNENDVWPWHPVRNLIINKARAEVNLPFSDQPTPLGQLRPHWERLKGYFDTSFPQNWNALGPFTPPGETMPRMIRLIDGVQRSGYKVPAFSTNPPGKGVEWCGVFAAYCWASGGVPGARWTPSRPAVSGPLPCVPCGPPTNWLPLPGDMLILKGGLSHHVIMEKWPRDDGTFPIISGNNTYQALERDWIPYERVEAFYSVDSVPGVLAQVFGF